MTNYSTFICPFDSGKCGKEGKNYKNLNIVRTNSFFFFDEVTIYPCVVKSKVIQPQSKYLKPEILIRKRLLRDIH